jgi:hypothetical protein
MKTRCAIVLALVVLVAAITCSRPRDRSTTTTPRGSAGANADAGPTPANTDGNGYEPAQQCDPNYSGCVPIASDVDCAGGKGNGPAYVRGPIRVIGRDIYGLDRDGDGIACE